MAYAAVALIGMGIAGIVFSAAMGGDQQMQMRKEEARISFALCGDDEIQQIAEETARIFRKQNHCRVDVYCYSTREELESNILGQIAGGDTFDVFIITDEMLSRLSGEKEFQCLDDVVEKRHQSGEDFYQVALSCGQTDGVQYALPSGVDPCMIYYNRTMMEEAGIQEPQGMLERGCWNLDGFAACIREIREKLNLTGIHLYREWCVEEPFLLCGGGGWQEQGNGIGPDDTMLRTVEVLKQLKAEGALEMIRTEQYDTIRELFVEGKLPMMIGKLDMTRACSRSGFVWDIVPFPSAEGAFDNVNIDVSLIAVGKGRHVEQAKEFVDYYVSGFGQKTRLERGECQMPSLNMAFYTSMGDVVFPEHSNYYFFALENGYAQNRRETEREQALQLWETYMTEKD